MDRNCLDHLNENPSLCQASQKASQDWEIQGADWSCLIDQEMETADERGSAVEPMVHTGMRQDTEALTHFALSAAPHTIS